MILCQLIMTESLGTAASAGPNILVADHRSVWIIDRLITVRGRKKFYVKTCPTASFYRQKYHKKTVRGR
jgi:hypothetical protein